MFKKKRNEPDERVLILQSGGVIAPAQILMVTRRAGDNKFHTIDFDVEVQPEGGTPFRAGFRATVGPEHFSMYGGELVGHSGSRIWVVYNPSDLSRVLFDCFDNGEYSARHRSFNKLVAINDELNASGESAEAIITRVDDLDLAYPVKQSRAKNVHFDVTPKNGAGFQSEGNFLFADTAVAKYSVGRKVFVRFDPRDPKRVALDRERNKALK